MIKRILIKSNNYICKYLRYNSNIRNVGVVAHIDAGKTTTSEQMLFICGKTRSVGRVDTGDTVMDFLPQERERGITISSAAISFKWKTFEVNLIDTPGHVDFTIEVERSARVLDGVIVVVDAVSGVQAQTRTVWRQTSKNNIPAVVFINKMDRIGANYEEACKSIVSKLGANVCCIQIPLGSEDKFRGVVDLISMTTATWGDVISTSNSREPPRAIISKLCERDDIYPAAVAARLKLLEQLAEVDDIFTAVYFDTEPDQIKEIDVIQGLRRACMSGQLVPTISGASLRGKGVEPLLDCIGAFLPSPLDRPALQAINKSNGSTTTVSPRAKEMCAFVFKVVHDQERGPLAFVRQFSGKLLAKQSIRNSTRNAKERVHQLLRVSADDLDAMESLDAGNVGCIVGLKHTFTGDTLVADKGPLHMYELAGLTVPAPVFALSLEPESSAQQTDLEKALAILCQEDPSLQVELDKESGQTLLRGLGELHLEIVCDKLRRQHNLQVTTGRAYIAYRESVAENSGVFSETMKYDRTIGLKRLFASILFEVTPTGGSEAPTIEIDKSVKSAIPVDEYTALLDGLTSCFSRGPHGFPVVGMKIAVKQLERDGDTTPGAVRACVSNFMDTLLRGDNKELLEPVMTLEVELPAHSVGAVLSDLSVKRRAEIKDMLASHSKHTILATVPLATMLGYASSVRSMTQGEGSFSMEFLKHAPVDWSTAKLDMNGP